MNLGRAAHPTTARNRVLLTPSYTRMAVAFTWGFSSQGYGYFSAGHGPAYVEGVRLEAQPDDGSEAWQDLFEQAQQGPVRGRWEGN